MPAATTCPADSAAFERRLEQYEQQLRRYWHRDAARPRAQSASSRVCYMRHGAPPRRADHSPRYPPVTSATPVRDMDPLDLDPSPTALRRRAVETRLRQDLHEIAVLRDAERRLLSAHLRQRRRLRVALATDADGGSSSSDSESPAPILWLAPPHEREWV
eukprot:TRINITY_DN14395_c0_g1_i1.p2 TRINITY_DN14395_c0_g1~~TRINITY_DN14395_c0_g1_i1.p2  ORF type:complete len:183 (+),score=53.26 TRINITY_DN14395_c0_g1_i1:72-551(+)